MKAASFCSNGWLVVKCIVTSVCVGFLLISRRILVFCLIGEIQVVVVAFFFCYFEFQLFIYYSYDS